MEIERKYFIKEENINDIKRRLSMLGELIPFAKKDRYYIKDGSRIRIRSNEDLNSKIMSYYITYKNKKLVNGTEVNEEYESKIEDPDVLIRFFKDAGFTLEFCKVKVGDTLKFNEVTFDLSQVNNLGTFLEIEIVTDDSNTEYAINKIITFQEMLGLTMYDAENRSYMELAKLK